MTPGGGNGNRPPGHRGRKRPPTRRRRKPDPSRGGPDTRRATGRRPNDRERPRPVGTAPRLARPRQTILVATHNRGKIAEILHRLEDLPLELKILDDFPDMAAPVEDGATFFANARKKALHYSRRTDLVVLSEDSGLAVDALDGAPGVRSARFGGSGATDADKIRLLLSKLDGVRWDYRTARFVCVAAVARQGEILASFEGQVEGRIAMEPTGSGGFGYDPVFIHEESGRSFADMTREEKGKVSHRGKALDQLALWLRGFMGEGPRKPHRPGPRRT